VKKIDLHIHTIPTIFDAHFEFDLNKLENYVSASKIDAIAITNHNIFDTAQFAAIQDALDVLVLPGIEITLDCGHILIISDPAKVTEFAEKAAEISSKFNQLSDSISTEELLDIFNNLSDYIIIPHYQKKPHVHGNFLSRLSEHIFTGEVDSAKKFIRMQKRSSDLVPVLFSDARISEDLINFPTRQTYVDCGNITFSALKICLSEKRKVFLSEKDGNKLFQIFSNGQMLSTGLNVLLGERSSGKTYTLNAINKTHNNVKYIKQFSLVQQDEEAYEKDFNNELKRTRCQFVDNYLSDFKGVLDDVINVDLSADQRAFENYLSSLLESAEEADKRDSFSKTALFAETEFSISEDKVLSDLISSVRQLIENVEYAETIDKFVDRNSLKQLAIELIELLWEKRFEKKKKELVNNIVRDIKEILNRRTSAVQIKEVDFYQASINLKKVEKFTAIANFLQSPSTISKEQVQGFKIVATKAPFSGAGEIKNASGIKTAFKNSFRVYGQPYDYLRSLLDNDDLTPSEIYKIFVKISYRILNRDGCEVSGGERSEFRLLQEIKDAQNYDLLLIDEPESSFDNLFLRSDVNKILKEVSEFMPVVVVTHNSTVGSSVHPDYLLYAQKIANETDLEFRLYSGYPTDLYLETHDGKAISNYTITMNSLEAGHVTYENRRATYEAIKDR